MDPVSKGPPPLKDPLQSPSKNLQRIADEYLLQL